MPASCTLSRKASGNSGPLSVSFSVTFREKGVHGAYVPLNFSNAAQLRDFGEQVLPHVR